MASLRLTVCAALTAVLFLVAGPAAAGFIDGEAVDNGDGTFTYFYAVNNRGGVFDISAWSLDLTIAAPDWNPLDVIAGGDVLTRDGWIADAGIPVVGLSAQDFLSLSPDSDVIPGGMGFGFSFRSAYGPDDVTYHVFSPFGESSTGSVVGPSSAPIPEPGAISTFASGLVLVAATLRRRTAGKPAAA